MSEHIEFKTREPIGSSTYPMPDLAWDRHHFLETLQQTPDPYNRKATLYIHIPFCDQICSFCGFNKFVSTEDKKSAYLIALLFELQSYAAMPYVQALEFQAVYLGGGTPNSLSAEQLKILLKTIQVHFNLIPDCEITCEGTPQNFAGERLQALKEGGVNRVSAGIQTLNSEIRKNYLNMTYHETDLLEFIQVIENNFDNYNLDFIYNLPHQTSAIFSNDLKAALASKATHLTLYPLVLLERTAFYTDYVKKSKRNIPAQEREIDFFNQMRAALKNSDFFSYTIRDWAKPNQYCRYIHCNAHCNQILACGAGAHGFIGNMTYRNLKNLRQYGELLLNENELPVEAYRPCGTKEIMQRFMVMGLRLWELDMLQFNHKFDVNWQAIFGDKINNLVSSGYLELFDNKLKFTERGHIWANNVRTYFEEQKTTSVGYSDSVGIGKSGKDHYTAISRIKATADIESHS